MVWTCDVSLKKNTERETAWHRATAAELPSFFDWLYQLVKP